MVDPKPHRHLARLSLIDTDVGRRAVIAATLVESGYGSVLGYDHVETSGLLDSLPTADLVLLDLDADGRTADPVHALSTAAGSRTVSILGLTSDASPEGRLRAAQSGAADFAVRPVSGVELCLRIDAALDRGRLQRLLADAPLASAPDSASPSDADTVQESLSMLAAVADYHDDDTNQHARRVGLIAAAIARALDCPAPYVLMLGDAAPLHDIGKVGISRRILLKPDKLTPPEWLHMMGHVDVGATILGSARAPVFQMAAEIARTHHERWDGTGYSAGLSGAEVPLSGRIVAVADVWDTLTHRRPYRPAWTPERALDEILAQSGAHFDPVVVTAFASLGAFELPRIEAAVERAAA